jgi:hypothetical protein
MQRDDSIVSLPFKLQGADFAAFMFILIPAALLIPDIASHWHTPHHSLKGNG